MTLGEKLRKARERRNFGLRELAKIMDVTAGHLSRVERDEKVPSPRLLWALCRRLQIKHEDLLCPTCGQVRRDRL